MRRARRVGLTVRLVGLVPEFLLGVIGILVAMFLSPIPAIAIQSLTGHVFEAASADPTMRMAVALPPGDLLRMAMLAGVVEEAIFRVAPLGLFLAVARHQGLGTRATTAGLVALIAVTSVLFGYLHGSLEAILFQGVGGVVLAVAFVAAFRARGWLYAALLVMVGHAAYDIVAVTIAATMFRDAAT